MSLDWVRLHAAANDLPAALLVASVLFDLIGTINRRDSLKAAGFWCLVLGIAGGVAAVLTGRAAEGVVDHTDAAHAVMTTHETMAYVVLGLFGVLAAWRLVRRGVWGDRERPIAVTAGVIGVALMVLTGRLGGQLVFDHGLGTSTTRLQGIVEERGGHDHDSHSHGADSTAADSSGADSTGAAHTHPDGTDHEH